MKEKQISELELTHLYVDKRMSAVEIGKILYCNSQTILNHLKRYKIKIRRNSPRMIQSIKIPNEKHLSYIAGIVDGEGTVSTGISYGNKGGYAPLLFVTNTEKTLINWLVSTIGGKIVVNKPEKPHYKTVYRWRVDKTLDTYLLLKALSPYLIIKKQDALAVIKLCKERLDMSESMEKRNLIEPRYLTSEAHKKEIIDKENEQKKKLEKFAEVLDKDE